MSVVLVLKLVLVPMLIWGVTYASRRWGPAVAGWISAFPIFSAPVLLILALEHGTEFAEKAVVGTFGSLVSSVAFGLGYSWGATRFHWPASLALGFIGYFGCVALMTWWAAPLPWVTVAVLAALLVAPKIYPTRFPTSRRLVAASTSDLPWRIGTAMVTVLLLTHFAGAIGPQLSGALAMFPILASVLVVFSHRQSGPAFAVRLLRGMVVGYYAFGVFCVALSLALPRLQLGWAFMVALAAAVLVQAVSRYRLRHGHLVNTPEPTTPV